MPKLFSNTKDAFSLKSDSELLRAKFLFNIINNRFLVKFGAYVANLTLKLKLPVKPIIKATVYNHFCGGEDEKQCELTIQNMFKYNVYSVLDFSTEDFNNESDFDLCYEKKISLIEYSKSKKEIPFTVFKPTCIGKASIFEKISLNHKMNENEKESWSRIKKRFHGICKTAKDNNVKILIDAEEFFVQKAIDELALEMMLNYNKKQVIVYNTVQMYRHDRMRYLKKLILDYPEVLFGFKLVRGAYMEKERKRAIKYNYKSPICKDKLTTDKNFDSAIDFIFQNLNRINFVCGSHNELSTQKILNLMSYHNIDVNDNRVWFGQLFGMSDNISFNLAKSSYNVFKIIPFGPVKNLIPYLIRRAQENSSVKGQSGRELNLIQKEIKRRKLKKS